MNDVVKRIRKQNKWLYIICSILFIIAILLSIAVIHEWLYYILFFPLLFITIVFFWLYRDYSKNNSLVSHIKDWSAVIKDVEISSFEYYYHHDSDWGSTSWYYIHFSDWDWNSDFKYDAWSTSRLYWVSELHKDDFYEEYCIPFDPDHKDRMKKFIDDKILQFEQDKESVWFFDKKKINRDIRVLKSRRSMLEDYRLVKYEWIWISGHSDNFKTYCIWDTYKVYIDPIDKANYFIDLWE